MTGEYGHMGVFSRKENFQISKACPLSEEKVHKPENDPKTPQVYTSRTKLYPNDSVDIYNDTIFNPCRDVMKWAKGR